MADTDIKYPEALYKIFWQIHLNDMPDGVHDTFRGLEKSGNLNKDMLKWVGKIGKELPDPNDDKSGIELKQDEWEKLYREFQTVLRTMSQNKESLEDNKDAQEYLGSLYGTDKLFGPAKVDSATKGQIEKLVEFLQKSGRSIGAYFAKQAGITDYDGFLNKIKDGKYNEDSDLRSKFENISENINHNIIYGGHEFSSIRNEWKSLEFRAIEAGFNEADQVINPHKLEYFKVVLPGMLEPLVRKEKLRDAFNNNNGGKILRPLTKALKDTNYNDKDGKNYLPPKFKDTLTPWQTLNKKINDTLDDTVLKLENRAKSDKYVHSDTSKPITLAIYGAKWKPKDGLEKLLEKAPEIQKKLDAKSPVAAQHFKYMIDALNAVKNGGMGKAFAGALKNSAQGLAIDQAIGLWALDTKGKIDKEAETVVEVLSKLRWGYTTSTMRENLAKANGPIFGNMPSIQKSDTMKFMANATDKTIHTLIMGTFNLANIGVNAIRRRGRYFKKGKNNLDKIMKDRADNNKDEKTAIKKRIDRDNKAFDSLADIMLDGVSLSKRIKKCFHKIKEYQEKLDTADSKASEEKYEHRLNMWKGVLEGHKKILMEAEEQNDKENIVEEKVQAMMMLDESISADTKILKDFDKNHKNELLEFMAFRNFVNGQGGYVKNRNPFNKQSKVQEAFNEATEYKTDSKTGEKILDENGKPIITKRKQDDILKAFKDRYQFSA
ncbi:MAG: hypothetical protein FWF34_01410 [Alphaproteobacteria bacterium]|nr:hypothetical protein [Alphaproteobacteria bacterium]MCL2889898.1 hypothetical protein [Alphaproteobacteria bacterium]